MTPKQKHHLFKVVQFSMLWLVFGMLYLNVEKGILGDAKFYPATNSPYDFASAFQYIFFGSIILGGFVGSIETYVITGLFKKISFLSKLVIKTIFYLIIITLFLITISSLTASSIFNVPVTDPLILSQVKVFITTFSFYSVVIYISFACILTLFFAEIRDNLGIFVFANFLRGKYHKPRVEERIFMFMDMKSSTTIAEKLGHIRYYDLLNQYYSDMSDAILNAYGEIYQYVGDEVIISWPLKKGLNNNNCIRCFDEIKRTIKNKSEKYLANFEIVPEFKAALHCGLVTSGEIGKLKKEIVFSGDVLNTTSRIQNRCNEYNAKLLISQQLLDLLPDQANINTEVIGEVELRGKNEKVIINKVVL